MNHLCVYACLYGLLRARVVRGIELRGANRNYINSSQCKRLHLKSKSIRGLQCLLFFYDTDIATVMCLNKPEACFGFKPEGKQAMVY